MYASCSSVNEAVDLSDIHPAVGVLLWPYLHSRLIDFLVSLPGLQCRSSPQQQYPYELWPARHCYPCTRMSPGNLHPFFFPSTVPCPCCGVCGHRFRQWYAHESHMVSGVAEYRTKGLEDAGYCAWLGNMVNANRLQGFLHGCYSLGATLGPTIATSMIVKAGLPWYTYYYMMVCKQ